MLSSGTMLAAVPAEFVDQVMRDCREQDFDCAVIGKLTSAASGFQLIDNNHSGELPIFQTDEVTRALAMSG